MFPHEPNLALVRDIISTISFPQFPLPISVRLLGRAIEITLHTRDRTTSPVPGHIPAPIVLTSKKEAPPWFQGPQDIEKICMWVIEEVMDLLKHEVMEHFLLNGERVLDPHKAIRATPGFLPEQALKDLFPLAPSKHP